LTKTYVLKYYTFTCWKRLNVGMNISRLHLIWLHNCSALSMTKLSYLLNTWQYLKWVKKWLVQLKRDINIDIHLKKNNTFTYFWFIVFSFSIFLTFLKTLLISIFQFTYGIDNFGSIFYLLTNVYHDHDS